MGAAAADINQYSLRVCVGLLVASAPPGVALAAAATGTSIVQTLPPRHAAGAADVAAELPPHVVVQIADGVAVTCARCAEAESKSACLAFLGATLTRCGAATVLSVAGPLLDRIGAMFAADAAAGGAGRGADPAVTRSCLALVRAVVQVMERGKDEMGTGMHSSGR